MGFKLVGMSVVFFADKVMGSLGIKLLHNLFGYLFFPLFTHLIKIGFIFLKRDLKCNKTMHRNPNDHIKNVVIKYCYFQYFLKIQANKV